MGPFQGFHRRAVVVVPSEEEYERRKEKKQKEGGRKITYDNNMKWKAAMSLPDEDEDAVFYRTDPLLYHKFGNMEYFLVRKLIFTL